MVHSMSQISHAEPPKEAPIRLDATAQLQALCQSLDVVAERETT